MAIPVEMPKMSDTMEEGVLVAWLEEEGAELSAGDIIAQVETDKATMDLEVYDDGTLLKRVVDEGAAVPIGGLIAILGDKGEDTDDIIAKYAEKGGERPSENGEEASTGDGEEAAPSDGRPEAPVADVPPEGDVKASPLARRMAQERNLDLTNIQGSGPDGRVIKRDIEAIIEGKAEPAPRPPEQRKPRAPERAPAPPAVPPRPVQPAGDRPEVESLPISQMRKTIARRLSESKFGSPHFYETIEVDMERAIQMRTRLNSVAEARGLPKISFNDIVLKACAAALRLHPDVNASYVESEGVIKRYRDIHIGVAVAVDEGLLTPVVRNADLKGLAEIAGEVKHLAEKARAKELQPPDWEGSTFTISNLGMFGIDSFTAIINPPNACILAVGGIRDVPVVKDGAVVPGKRMAITLSCDHRVVDGVVGARYLNTVRTFLEDPSAILL